jgi:ABC-type dipeptide/oligopeptide/nickel transport system permease subunit
METGAVFPAVLVLAILIGLLEDRAYAVTIGLAFVAAVRFYPHARDTSVMLAKQEFVDYARVLGERDVEVNIRHLLPNIVREHGRRFLVLCADLIVVKANLTFLGLVAPRWSVVDVSKPLAEPGLLPALREAATLDWGVLLTAARSDFVRGIYFPSLFPALMLIAVVWLFRWGGRGGEQP